jgi:outer membrane protein insertion porin family
VEVLKEIRNIRLSPLLAVILAIVAILDLPTRARGETIAQGGLPTESATQAEPETPADQKVAPTQPSSAEVNSPPSQAEEKKAETTDKGPQLPEQETSPAPEAQPPGDSKPPTPESPTLTPESPTLTPESPTPASGSGESPIPPTPTPTSSEPAPEPRVLVAEVAVSGAETDLQELVYRTIRTQPGRTATRSQLQEDVNAIYATGYFANVKVTPEDTPLGVRVIFAVQPNPILKQVVIDTVPATAGKDILPPEVVSETFKDQYGKILNLRDFQEGIKTLNQWYSKNGYELAQVVGSPQVADDGTVTLVIAEGVIEKIQVRYFDAEDQPAEPKTREFIITREMQLQAGDVFNRNIAQKDLQRVFGLGIFEDARLSFSPGEDPREVIVNVDIVEGNTGSLAAGAGISSSSGLFGTVSYQQQNLGGNNQTVGVEFQLGEREILFDASFSDPWIGGDPYRTSYTVDVFRRRSISLVFDGDNNDIKTENGDDRPRVVRTGGGISFGRPLADDPFSKADWILTTGFQYQHVQIENSDGDISPLSSESDGLQQLAWSRSGIDDLFIVRFTAAQDTRDSTTQPTSGSFLRLGVEQTIPVGSGSILFNRLRGNFSYYIPVKLINFDFTKGPQALAFNIQAGTVINNLPPYEAFILGGSNSVRGYAEGELGNGRSYVQATAEYRFPIYSIVGGAIFFDAGTTLGSGDTVPGDPSGVRDLPGSGYAFGIGVRVQSPVGPIRVDYAINDQGDSRVNFGIGEKF